MMKTKTLKTDRVIANGVHLPSPLRLDLGCGKNKRADGQWWGVDCRNFEGVDQVVDLREPWPWNDNSVEEIHASHFVEHLHMSEERPERQHFANEAYRVLKPGGKMTVIVPNWSSCRAYGDYSHVWPPVSQFWFYYLSKAWREINAPHNELYTCDFDCVWGYNVHPTWQVKANEAQQFALQWYIEAAQDIISTWTKKV